MLPALGSPALFAWFRMPRARAFCERSRGILCVGRRLRRLRHPSAAASRRPAFSSSCRTISRTLGATHPYSPQPVQPTRLDWTFAPAGRPRAAPLPRSAYADGPRRSKSPISLEKSCVLCGVRCGCGRSLCADVTRESECCATLRGAQSLDPWSRLWCGRLPVTDDM